MAGGARGDVAADLDQRGIRGEEGAEDSCLGRVADCLVVDRDGLHRRPQHVGEQDELLPPVVGDMSCGGEEVDALLPFVPGQPHLAEERMQVSGEGLHDLLEPVIRGVPERLDDQVGEFLLPGPLFG